MRLVGPFGDRTNRSSASSPPPRAGRDNERNGGHLRSPRFRAHTCAPHFHPSSELTHSPSPPHLIPTSVPADMAYYSGGGGKLSAVDAILAEAADLVALEQIAKLNTAHLADDSALPSSLEARFRKLKSLPSPAAPTPVKKTLARSVTAPGPAAALPATNPPAAPPAPDEPHPPAAPAPAGHEDPPPLPGDAETKGGGSSPRQDRAPAPAPAVHDADDDAEDLERLFGSGPRGRPTLRERNRGTDSSTSASRSPSPPRQACCFGFSPKKPLQRAPSSKSKQKKVHHGSGNDVLGVDADEWGDENRRMAAELREQQRRLRKALQDQVQVSRETGKMARWVKQASARMTHVEAIGGLLSDCEDDEELR